MKKLLTSVAFIIAFNVFVINPIFAKDNKLILKYGKITVEGYEDQNQNWGEFIVFHNENMKQVKNNKTATIMSDKKLKFDLMASFSIKNDFKKSVRTYQKPFKVDIRRNSKECTLYCDFKHVYGKRYSYKMKINCREIK